jgi:hypothetical protein
MAASDWIVVRYLEVENSNAQADLPLHLLSVVGDGT